MRRFIGLTVVVLMAFASLPQALAQRGNGYSISNKRLIGYYNKAVETLNLGDWKQAQIQLEELIENNPTFVEPCIAIAYLFELEEEYEKAYAFCVEAVRRDSTLYPIAYFKAGRMAFMAKNYPKAIFWLQKYLNIKGEKEKNRQKAKDLIRNCEYAISAPKLATYEAPKPLGPEVNTELDEYFPSLSADGRTLCFTRLVPQNRSPRYESRSRVQEDLYITRRGELDKSWGMSFNLGAPVCSGINEGSQSLSASGREMYISRCNRTCSIVYSRMDDRGRWTKPVALPAPINLPGVSSKQPSISPDGKHLYFCSERKGTLGGLDLWVATADEHGKWYKVTNLGPTINTEKDEQSPFIHFDNKTLYFSSEGHPGLGALDLFKSERKNDTTWATPTNLGAPINTPSVDMGLVVSARGDTAYYASERNAKGGLDIFQFPMPESIQPTPASYLQGIVQDAATGAPIKAAIILVDLSQGDTVMTLQSNELGNFLVCLPIGKKYALFASAENYFDNSMPFDFKGEHPRLKPYKQTIGLKKIEKGASLLLANTFFDTDSDTLHPESYIELDRWVNMLETHPTMRIRIVGYTDNQGEKNYNRALSLRRAKSVANYIVTHGIQADRVVCLGKGEDDPKATNQTEEGRARNRRTECHVIDI